MPTWVETASETFVARHDERDAADAERVLAQLEYARERLERQLEVELGRARGRAARLARAARRRAAVARAAAAADRAGGAPLRRRLGRRARAARALAAAAGPAGVERRGLAGDADARALARCSPGTRSRAGHPGFPPPLGPLRLRALDALRRGSSRAPRSGCRARRATCGPAVARRLREGRRAGVPAQAAPTRCCSAARCSTCWPARRASARRVAAARDGADRAAAPTASRPRRAPHRGRLALAPRPAWPMRAPRRGGAV